MESKEKVHVAFLLDSSGSISADDWALMQHGMNVVCSLGVVFFGLIHSSSLLQKCFPHILVVHYIPFVTSLLLSLGPSLCKGSNIILFLLYTEIGIITNVILIVKFILIFNG